MLAVVPGRKLSKDFFLDLFLSDKTILNWHDAEKWHVTNPVKGPC